MSRGNKFFAKKTPCKQGHTHASGREAKRCNELHLMLRAGDIEDLELQPQFWFEIDGKVIKHSNGRRVGYKADFLYTDRREAVRVVEDAKGPFRDNAWTLRKAIFKALNPHLVLREV